MGCSCSKGIKPSSAQQPRKNQRTVTHVIHKSPGSKKTIRRVLERY